MKTLDEVLTVEPYKYQKEGILAAIKHHYIIIGDEMGLGKSLQALAITALTREKTLVVCPAYLKQNWSKEYNKFCKDEKRILIIKGAKDLKDYSEYDVIIIGYSMLKSAKDLFAWANIIIADEAHYLKNSTALRTKFFFRNLNDYSPERLIMLTGTPIDKHIIEFYNLLLFCSFNMYETSGQDITEVFKNRWQFNDYFARRVERKFKVKGKTIRKTEWKGLKNLEGLRKILKGKFIRRKANKVLDLPELIYRNINLNVKLESDKELYKEWSKFEKGNKFNIEVKAHSAYLKAPHTVKYVKELLDELDDYIVIFTDHLSPIPILYNELSKYYPCKVITGEVEPDRRDKIVNSLQRGEIRVLICTIGSGSVGFNMTKANHIVFNDKSWKVSNNDQAIKRIHRIGQKNKCVIHFLMCFSVDNKIEELLKDKKRNINHIL